MTLQNSIIPAIFRRRTCRICIRMICTERHRTCPVRHLSLCLANTMTEVAKSKQAEEPLKWDREWWLLRNDLSRDEEAAAQKCSLPHNAIKMQCTSGHRNKLCSYFQEVFWFREVSEEFPCSLPHYKKKIIIIIIRVQIPVLYK